MSVLSNFPSNNVDKHASQHAAGGSDPISLADIGVSNPNLLDNWYFGNPVNQRGKTEYNTTSHAIDRWRTWDSPTSTWLKVVEGGIQIAYTCYQFFEQYIYRALIGKKVTTSILFADGKLFYKTHTISESVSDWYALNINYGGVRAVTLGISPSNPSNLESNFFRINAAELGTLSDTILAIKLEFGSQQTLAHQDADGNWVLNEIPDYGEQLRRCQRYALALSKQSGHSVYGSGMINAGQKARIVVPLPVTMRKIPAVYVNGDVEIIADGTTYSVTSVSAETLSPNAVCLLVNSTALSSTHSAAPALLRSYGGGQGELLLTADL